MERNFNNFKANNAQKMGIMAELKKLEMDKLYDLNEKRKENELKSIAAIEAF